MEKVFLIIIFIIFDLIGVCTYGCSIANVVYSLIAQEDKTRVNYILYLGLSIVGIVIFTGILIFMGFFEVGLIRNL